MKNIDIQKLRSHKAGRALSTYYLENLALRTTKIINELKLDKHVSVMTFGSAGGLFFTGNSDTDFSILDDGTICCELLAIFQERLYKEFKGRPWTVSFKSWQRLKVNPMDVLSLRFLCGNMELFRHNVLKSKEISEVVNEQKIVALLAGNDLHLDFMASSYFSRLLNRYHPSHELPIPISFGDVKYYKGGLRSIQYLYMISMLYSRRCFLFQLKNDNNTMECSFLTKDDVLKLKEALDFFLAAKDLCIEGNNIFNENNLSRIQQIWHEEEDTIYSKYKQYIFTIEELCKKAHKKLIADFEGHEGVIARCTNDKEKLIEIIESQSLDLWRTIALRKDLDEELRHLLGEKIEILQQTAPHTMLDELKVMLDYAYCTNNHENKKTERTNIENQELWLTDEIYSAFDRFLEFSTDRPVLIRWVVHNSFFDIFERSSYTDPKAFAVEYLDRVKKYFHCHTLFPDREYKVAMDAVKSLLASGYFSKGKIALLELHLTNRCNLNCKWCTYSDRDIDKTLPFEMIYKIIELSPAEILIAGGGEPTLYHENGNKFSDVICLLRRELPGARIRLITNGTFIPEGPWFDKIDEISISLDEGTKDKFLLSKGRDMFDRVFENIQRYIFESPLECIRISKVYCADNLLDALPLSEKIFNIWNKLPEHENKRRFLKFMLFAMANDHEPGNAYALSRLNAEQNKAWQKALSKIKEQNPLLYNFLNTNTNLLSIVENLQTECIPEHCWNSANYILVGADGIVYPCFASCAAFGSINFGSIEGPIDELTKKRAELFRRPPLGCLKGCRPGNVFYGLQSRNMYIGQKNKLLPCLANVKENHSKVIIHVSYHDPEHLLGGQGWAVNNLCRQQVKSGYQVYWISPCVKNDKPGEYLYENGRLRVIKIKFTNQCVETLFADSYENHQLREEFGSLILGIISMYFSPESCVVHLHGCIETPKHSAELRAKGYKVLSTFHMLMSTRRQHIMSTGSDLSYMKQAEYEAISNNSTITIPAQGMIKELSGICPDYKGNFYCIHNGIGDEHFGLPEKEKISANNIIISYGRISPEKGFDLLIEAAKLYTDRQSKDSTEFVIFGNTDMTIEARKAYAVKLSEMANGYNNIHILASLTGIIGQNKIDMIDQALLGVIPSLYEPFGLVIPELMARHKPVIATYTTGACEIMKTYSLGKNDFGFLVRPEPLSIYDAILWMLEHPEKCKEMGENAYERACDFRWDKISKQFLNLYDKL